jgi:oxygen-independent coproporphyrinogen-3 oxidase
VTAAFGVYVHVPFCTSRCDYCAFATWTDRFGVVGPYVEACRVEIKRVLTGGIAPATSVFFGGGTPSLLSPDDLGAILSAVPRAPGAEVTVECNPETVDLAKLRGYRDRGVTRLSFGVQSMDDRVLAGLGRRHRGRAVTSAIEAAAGAGFAERYSVDLIFGGAGETFASWEGTLRSVLSLDPPPRHVSAYALTVEPGTPLASDAGRHPDPDDQADKYELADTVLAGAGLDWYEISNWAAPGAQCAHNRLYWDQGEYLGVGCAAHSHRVDRTTGSARRWWNVRTPERYIRHVEAGVSAEAGGENLDSAARRAEALQLSLRTRHGIPASALPGWEDDPTLSTLVERAEDGRLALTRTGRLLANEVAVRLVA